MNKQQVNRNIDFNSKLNHISNNKLIHDINSVGA